MATIGEVGINVVARTGKLRKGLRQSQGMLAGFQKMAMRAGGALAVAFSVRAIKGFVTQAANAVDESNKLARVLGVSLEAMQGIEHASSLTGANIDAITKAMTRLSVATGKAGDVALLEFAERMDGIADAAERTRLAVSMFGERGAMDVLKLMDGGSAGLRAAMAERASFGVVSASGAAGIERANDAMTRLKTAGNALWQQVADKLAPAVEGLANSFIKMGPAARVIARIADVLAHGFMLLVQQVAIAARIIEMIGNSFKGLYQALRYGSSSAEAEETRRQTLRMAQHVNSMIAMDKGPIAEFIAAQIRTLAGDGVNNGKPLPVEIAGVKSTSAREFSKFLAPGGGQAQLVQDKGVKKAVDDLRVALLQRQIGGGAVILGPTNQPPLSSTFAP